MGLTGSRAAFSGPTVRTRLAFVVALALWISGPLAGSPALAQGPGDDGQSPLSTNPLRSASPVPTITLYTMGTGALVFEKWGHAAICVEYPRPLPPSVCYNYGSTDFTSPVEVIWDFVRGAGVFWVSTDDPAYMIERYMGYDRSLWRQVLPLSDEQAIRAANILADAALPENRNYIYHHFFDNCSTRVRDIIDQVTDGQLRPGTDHIVGPTYRDYSRQGFAEMTWALIGTDYLLARQADEQPTLWQAMFLPDVLRDQVTERFAAEPKLIYQRRGPDFSTDPGHGGRPLLFVVALFLALLVALARWYGRHQRLAIAVAVTPPFLISVVVWGLPAISSIEALRYNEALLVHLPLDLALIWLAPARRQRYAQLRTAWLAGISILSAVGLFTQPLWAPIALVFAPLAVIAAPTFPHRIHSDPSGSDQAEHETGAVSDRTGRQASKKKAGQSRKNKAGQAGKKKRKSRPKKRR